jgi:hypothetical protein
MATAISAPIRRTLNWEKSIDILSLIPDLRECRIDIDPPEGSQIVLWIEGHGYFRKFHAMLRGPATSPNIVQARRLDNLLVAASFAVFIAQDSPGLQHKIFVELVKGKTDAHLRPR